MQVAENPTQNGLSKKNALAGITEKSRAGLALSRAKSSHLLKTQFLSLFRSAFFWVGFAVTDPSHGVALSSSQLSISSRGSFSSQWHQQRSLMESQWSGLCHPSIAETGSGVLFGWAGGGIGSLPYHLDWEWERSDFLGESRVQGPIRGRPGAAVLQREELRRQRKGKVPGELGLGGTSRGTSPSEDRLESVAVSGCL